MRYLKHSPLRSVAFSLAFCTLAGWLAFGHPANAVARLRVLVGLPVVSEGIDAQSNALKAPQDGAIKAEALQQIAALIAEKNSRTPAQRKIDSQLLQAVKESRGEQMALGASLERANPKLSNDGALLVDITADVSDALLANIQQLGGEIVFPSAEYRAIRAQVPFSSIETIAGYPEVSFIRAAVPAKTSRRTVDDTNALSGSNNASRLVGPTIPSNPIAAKRGRRLSFAERAANVRARLTNYLAARAATAAPLIGSVTSQGDKAHQADTGRAQFGFAGEGIRIGIMSDSFNYLGGAAADIAGGDLPGIGNPFGNLTPVTVVQDLPIPNGIVAGSDEGRAMTQIVHDLAPKAQLFFASAFISEAGFATNIKRLRNAPNNCDVVIDDVFYSDEASFQDGIVAQAVNYVTSSGGLYFSSAGNEGSVRRSTASVWEGDFNDGGSLSIPGNTKTGTVHNFATSGAPILGDIIQSNGGFVFALDWSDPLGASTNDYDLFIINAAGTTVKAASTNIQNGTIDPHEEIANSSFSLQTNQDRVVIFKTSGAAVRALSMNGYGSRLAVFTTGNTHGHSAAADAFGVAAAAATAANTVGGLFTAASRVETFSSDGPRRIFYNQDGTPITPGNLLFATNGGVVRQKPDITAADNVTTSGNSLGGGLTQFSGTSAAAPHAGAIAALLKSANPSLTPAQIRTIMTAPANTIDIELAGVDVTTGYGILNANAILASAMAQQADLTLGTVTVTEGAFKNNNGVVEAGEYANIVAQLNNPSLTIANNVSATIQTSTPGVTVITGTASYGNIAAGGNASNTGTPFVIGLSPSVPCGSTINLMLTATLSNGSPVTFPLTVSVGSKVAATISSTLNVSPPAGAGYTATSGTKVGTLARAGGQATCATPKSAPLSGTGFSATAGGRYVAYTFTNPNAASQCVTVLATSGSANNLQTATFNNSGFVPTTSLNAGTNYLADSGTRAATMTYSFNVPGGQSFTTVIYDATTGGTAGATAYTLTVSLAACAAGPACTPVTVTTGSIASGSTGTPYSQAFAATGGSGAYNFSLAGGLPAGLTFSGNTLSGTPTQAGSFPLTLTVTDAAGCPAGTANYTLVIGGIAPASITATAGSGQTAIPGKAFATALQATVRDSGTNPLSGVNVTFSAPTSGASGTFPGGMSFVTVVTNGSGVATAPAFTANTTAGSYAVTASVVGVVPSATFNLTNACPASFIVTSTADDGPGTLRDALNNICTGTTITFAVTGTITLTSGELAVNKAVTITGPGAEMLAISGNHLGRVFNIAAGTGNAVNISGLTIKDGSTKADGTDFYGGGGVLIVSGTVGLTDSVITGNSATNSGNPSGGGVDNEGGAVTITRCSIVNNTITNNVASNGAFYLGGGVFSEGTSMAIISSTIAGNVNGPYGTGGGLAFVTATTLTNSTVFGNSANIGGNIARLGGTLTFKNNIIASGILVGTGGSGVDISGTGFSSQNYNLIQTTTGGTITGTTANNITSVSPNLLPLGNYGGPTPTLLPAFNSPVINVGDVALTSGTDQRGFPRAIGGRADIGAVETNYLFAATAGTPQSAVINTAFAIPLQATLTESGNPISGVTVTFTAPPASGPSGLFGASAITTAITNASGNAIAPTFTANGSTGQYNVVASVGSPLADASFSLTNLFGVSCPLVTLASLPNAMAGVAYSGSVVASPAGTYNYSVIQGSLPSGLVLDSNTGAVTGLPTVVGTYTAVVKATADGACGGTRTYTLTVGCPVVTISPATLPDGTKGTPYSQLISATPAGGSYSFSVTSGTLPSGLNLNPSTGALSGTPTVNGSFAFTITATGFGSCPGSKAYSVTIGGASCPTITLPNLPGGALYSPYSQSVAASPSGSYTYVLTGLLPPGVSFYNAAALLYGYPTTAGTFNFTITATDNNNCTGNKSYSVVIGSFLSAVVNDFDGDGKSDLAVWRGKQGLWLIANSSDGNQQNVRWGTAYAGDVVVGGDYDGDGKYDVAVYRRTTGEWLIKSSRDGSTITEQWGAANDVPVPADYDGDGKTDIAFWRASEGAWYIKRSSDRQVQTERLGASNTLSTNIPVPADYDGDGKADVAIFYSDIQQGGHWYIKLSSDGSVVEKEWGLGTDVPVAADYDGDGKADMAIWRAADANWYVVRSSDGDVQTVSAGDASTSDVPVPGDYDGDGKADIAVWHAAEASWSVKTSRDGNVTKTLHGLPSDLPVAAKLK